MARWAGSAASLGLWLVLGLSACVWAQETPNLRQLATQKADDEAPANLALDADSIPKGDELSKLSKSAIDIIGPMVQSFLQKEEMSAADRQCLVKGSEKFTSNVMLVASHVVMLVQEVMGQRTSMPGLKKLADVKLEAGNSGEAETQPAPPTTLPPTTSPTPEPAPSTTGGSKDHSLDLFYRTPERRLAGDVFQSTGILMHISAILMEMGTSLQLLVKLSNHIANECVDGEALESLQLAGAHARDIRYVGGHFLANGADVLTEMAHGAMAYKAGRYEEFGTNLGLALRKMLLSKGANSTVPSGIRGKYMMVNMSMGFVKGFFGEGFTLGIKLDQDPTEPLRIDLEDCIANNMAFFEQIWSALAFAYAQRSAADQTQGGPSAAQQNQGKVQFGTALAVAAMQFPDALRRCGLGNRQADMLIDSAKAFGEGMHLTLTTPNELASNDEIMSNLGKTINDWKKLSWYSFGYDLGTLLQELILTFFPKKYTIDSTGGLRQQLSELDGAGGLRLHGSLGGRLALALLPAALLLGVVAGAAVVGRSRRRLLAVAARDLAAGAEADADAESMLPRDLSDEAIVE